MEFTDQDRICVDCSDAFVYSGNDQRLHEAKGWQAPRRCFRCRAARRAAPPSDTPHSQNRMQAPFR
jgi:hypothetical protein